MTTERPPAPAPSRLEQRVATVASALAAAGLVALLNVYGAVSNALAKRDLRRLERAARRRPAGAPSWCQARLACHARTTGCDCGRSLPKESP